MNSLVSRLKRRLFKKKGEKRDFKDVIIITIFAALGCILGNITSYLFGISPNLIFSENYDYTLFFTAVFFAFAFSSALLYWKE